MKKIILVAISVLAMAFSASAQMDLVKKAKGDFKQGSDYNAFVEAISPAFSNPETANSAEPYYVAGKAGFDNYDYYINLYRIGQPIDEANMGKSLVKGYEFYQKALPLDSVVDAKGKVKTKYSKNILADMASHHDDFNIAAAMLWGVKDYQGAYDAWGIFLDMPGDARLGKNAPKQLADSIASTVNFNRALAAWQSNQLENALNSFDKAIALNYDDPVVYEYAAEIARQVGDKDRQLGYAKAGYAKSGSINDLRTIINSLIDANDFEAANNMLNEALNTATEDKDKAFLYLLRGILAENTDPVAAQGGNNVIENYRSAMQLDPGYGAAYFNYGRTLFNQANQLDNEAGNLTGAAYNKFKVETLEPILREAAETIEKGYELDNSLYNAPSLLQQIYYFLNDNENLERVKNL